VVAAKEDSYPVCGALLAAHPELLSDEAASLVDEAVLEADRRHDGAAVVSRHQHAAFLRRCRGVGLQALFPPDCREIDPLALASIRAEMAEADEAEARYDAGGDSEALAAAAASWRRIARHPCLETAHPALVAAVKNDAGGVLLRHVWEGGDGHDLSVAVEMLREAVSLTPVSSSLCASRLANLGLALRETYRSSGDRYLLAEAVEILRRGVAVGVTARARAAARGNLDLALEELYLLDGDPAHLDESISGAEEMLAVPDLDDDVRASRRVQLANSLRRRFEARADPADLDRAVRLLDQVCDETPPESPRRPRHLVDLAIALLDRHALRGHRADLERALTLCRSAANIMPAGSPDRPGCLVHLALGHCGATRSPRDSMISTWPWTSSRRLSAPRLVTAWTGPRGWRTSRPPCANGRGWGTAAAISTGRSTSSSRSSSGRRPCPRTDPPIGTTSATCCETGSRRREMSEISSVPSRHSTWRWRRLRRRPNFVPPSWRISPRFCGTGTAR
jgi:hypothetical protein